MIFSPDMSGCGRGAPLKAVLIAGTHSGCGKTTVTFGVLAALRKKGLIVQPFKTGPDFIDAGLHRLAADRVSRNLDQWMCGPEYVAQCFRKHAAGADVAVIEGVMGLYDGAFSSAHLAVMLGVPVVLVVDAYGMAESAGAMVRGFAEFGNHPPMSPLARGGFRGVAGVIFNRVASESHYQRLKESVRDVPVLGYLPRELDFEIPHRHLGLTIAEEDPITGQNIEKLADTVLKHIDVDALIQKSEDCGAAGMECREENPSLRIPFTPAFTCAQRVCRAHSAFRIALAYDKAFNFYYEDNLDLLRDAGAEIVRFSPIADARIPDADAVYIGGGYPELHAEELSRNTSMLASVRGWAEAGKPLYAECGGLMYLSAGIRDFDDRVRNMAGVFPFGTRMLRKPKLAYREIVLNDDCILGNRGEKCRGHEFHYSELEVRSEKNPKAEIYAVRDSQGRECGPEGYRFKNTLASYIHIHFGSNPEIAGRFAEFVVENKRKQF